MDIISESQQSLENVINLFEMEIDGVSVRVRGPPDLKKDRAGDYSPFFRRITIRKEIAPFWYATLTTLLHEFGHHRQRFLMYTIVILSIMVTILTHHNYILYAFTIGPLLVTFILLQKYHFEQDADNYMIQKIPDVIILLLSQLEVIAVANSLGSPKRSLIELHKVMTRYFPEFLS